MHFDERDEGDYRIYAGALEATGGYVAAVVVQRLRNAPGGPHEVYRDTSMSGGHRWLQPEQALRYAVTQATQLLRSRSDLTVC